jgi:hypothetical protein
MQVAEPNTATNRASPRGRKLELTMKDRAESDPPDPDREAAGSCKFRTARKAGARAITMDVEALFAALETRNRARQRAEPVAPAPASRDVALAVVLPFRRRRD